jgi:putative ABC transport system ATP-binding protein
MNILECKNVSLIRNNQTILSNVSLTVESGDCVGIMGPSGSGKSSLLRLLNLLMSPTQGEIFYKDKNLSNYAPTQLRQKIGYVLQKPYLFGTTVQENLMYPYQLLGQPADLDEIKGYFAQTNLPENMLEKKNTNLSGGEQQRIALIRSLLIKPDILLLDEVTAALDEENTKLLEKLIIHEQNRRGLTLLFVTHDPQQGKRLANKILSFIAGSIHSYGTATNFFSIKGDTHE